MTLDQGETDKSQHYRGYLEASSSSHFFEGPDSILDKHRIVGYRELRELLQPRHSYFSDKRGFLVDFASYKHSEDCKKLLCYPRVKCESRQNPFRLRQLARANTGRTVSKFDNVIKAWELTDFAVTTLEVTFPKEISEWLVLQKNGKQMAWRLWSKFWNEDLQTIDEYSSGQAAHVNLHVWRTECPIEPHVHFHAMIPNYRMVLHSDNEPDWYIMLKDSPHPMKLERRPWHRQRGGSLVPYGDDGLQELKRRWWDRVKRFARRKKIIWSEYREIDGGELEPNINLYVNYISRVGSSGRAKFMHRLNYAKRNPMEDYAHYSNRHLVCPDPPVWLEGYSNRPRVFGWWRELAAVLRGCKPMDSKEKLSPFTAEPMIYNYHVDLSVLESFEVGALSFWKGRPWVYDLKPEDMTWLRSVMWDKYAGSDKG